MKGSLIALGILLGPFCGDGNVDPGEDCENCPEDVICLPCEVCQNAFCVTVNCLPCGNGIVDPGETCLNCPEDVPCGPGEVCLGDACVLNCVPSGLPIDVVFVMDTSGSMDDEAEALCTTIGQIEGDLLSLGVVTNVTLLGITNNPASFECLTDNVENLLGVNLGNNEDWGPATSAVAEHFPWATIARIIVPISDEGPQTGDPCEDPGTDRNAIENAIEVANEFWVFVSPIAGTDSSECVVTLAMDLALGTGGTFFESTNPNLDLAGAIFDLVKAIACGCTWDLDGDGAVGITEMLALLAAWGTDPGRPPDFDGDGNVGITDFLELMGAWGPCS